MMDAVAGEDKPSDLLLVHGGRKARQPTIVQALRAILVPIRVIFDFDVLSEYVLDLCRGLLNKPLPYIYVFHLAPCQPQTHHSIEAGQELQPCRQFSLVQDPPGHRVATICYLWRSRRFVLAPRHMANGGQ